MRNHIAFCFLLLLVGCAETATVGNNENGVASDAAQEVVYDDPHVRSVQLHPDQSETALPIVELGSSLTLRLAFDIVEAPGRPLSIYIYHANRDWERDLFPSEFLTSFHQDEILDYRASGATIVPYVHYEYSLPNRDIDFKKSGNYVLRIAEQGEEQEPLFERRFFVTEQSTPVEMGLDRVMVAGNRSSSIQPIVRFRAPDANANAFDYSVCFVRNADLEERRCVTRPSLDVLPDMAFYLRPDEAFEAHPANYFIDLSEIRTGGRIERANQQTTPWRMEIEPDYARFSGTQLAPFLNGQMVIRSANRFVSEPDYSSEYVDAIFKFVTPDGAPISGNVFITGSFNNWQVQPENALNWNTVSNGYEAKVLLKQGHYEYQYVTSNEVLNRAMNNGLPQLENLYTSFIYYHDLFARTDRLIAVQAIKSE